MLLEYDPPFPNWSISKKFFRKKNLWNSEVFIYKNIVMKKRVIRLTESDLMRLVKRVIKEQELSDEGDSSDECENLFNEMGHLFEDFMSQAKITPGEIDSEEMYYELESQLGDILYMAEGMDCDFFSLEMEYKEYLDKFAEFLGINNNLY